jgi:hypothetical protein
VHCGQLRPLSGKSAARFDWRRREHERENTASTASSNFRVPGKKKYVLEDVFWVPISNSRWRHCSSHVLPELHTEELDTGEVASAGETEVGSAINLR